MAKKINRGGGKGPDRPLISELKGRPKCPSHGVNMIGNPVNALVAIWVCPRQDCHLHYYQEM